jgi:PAS domain S-box-containing protein
MTTQVHLQSLAETHERPFLILDDDNRIVAANQAFLSAYGTTLAEILNRPCYEVTHHNPRPCEEMGEECPKTRVRESGEPYTCRRTHTHQDASGRLHQVQIKGFPLRLENGESYFGEQFEEISVHVREANDRQWKVGSSKAFLASLEAMTLAARSDSPVLIKGESGTGKGLGANFLHLNSLRAGGPFLSVDCTVQTEVLLESELFGHVRGAFPGSVGERPGLFALAHGGTLFLDEIGDLHEGLQTKLLRTLESGEFCRLGSDEPIPADVRIICATNRNLASAVESGEFREDLYFRLACLTVNLPSLRQRRADIPELATLLLRQIARGGDRPLSLTEDAMEALMDYDFPGNVRELRHILLAASARAAGAIIERDLIEATISGSPPVGIETPRQGSSAPAPDEAAGSTGSTSLRQLERAHLRQLLDLYQGNRAAVATAMGISERTLYRKLKLHNLR